MEKRFIMTAFAKDRIGLVADITKIIYENDCNLEDTEMTQLEDEFVLMLLFTGKNKELIEGISKECRRLEREKGISAFVRELEEKPGKAVKSVNTFSLHVEGVDQAGIVYKISDYLARQSINISRLISRKTPSPESGTPIYTVEIEIEVPNEMSFTHLEQGLSELGQEMDIQFIIDQGNLKEKV
ncbi:MAG: ACT domain-containing protein [Candidatus Aminicenantes bacterium]|jgi:glycine cleavage system transcriptional repressor